jgi:integrase
MSNRKEGQLIRTGDRKWRVRIELERDVTGGRRTSSRLVRGSRKQAQAELNRLLMARDSNTLCEPSRQSTAEYLKDWLEGSAKSRLRPLTYESYRKLLERYVVPVLGTKRLSKVSLADVEKLYGDLKSRGLSPRTIRYTHVVLRSAFKKAVRARLLSQNPTDHASLPREIPKEMRYLSPDEATQFLDAAVQDPWFPLWLLLLTTGLRPSEALGLQWEDLDLETGTLSVRRGMVSGAGSWHLDQPKTASSRRSLGLIPDVTRSLVRHRAKQAEEKLALGGTYDDRRFVFAGRTGSPLDLRNLRKRHFARILTAAGLKTLRLYDLRHTCATLLLAQGINPKVVSERLGHASTAITLDVYSHVLPDMQRQANERMAAVLFPGRAAAAL